MSMCILYLSQLIPYPIDAGPKVRSYHVLQYLAQTGYEVTLVAFRRESDGETAVSHLHQFCTAIHTAPMRRSPLKDGWHLGRSLLTNQPFLIARDSVAAMHHLIKRLVQEHSFDAIHADQLWMAQYALAAWEANNGRFSPTLILDQHNAVYLIPQRLAQSTGNLAKKWLLKREASVLQRYEQAVCQQFDHVVWVTEEDREAVFGNQSSVFSKQLAVNSGETRHSVIPICVDVAEKQVVERRPNAHRVTFLGGLHWPPNAEGIVWFAQEVWPQVIAQCPNACLTIIGKNPPAELATSHQPPTTIDITGYVTDLEPYLQETAVFIVPLHAGGGMRVKILDAWSWGLPIVSTTIGAEGICYEDGADMLLADEADTFAQAVVSLLQDSDWAAAVGRNGRLTVETHYDWRKIYPAWDAVNTHQHIKPQTAS